MGLMERRIRVYLCDRCGAVHEAEGTQPAPAGWTQLLYGPDVSVVISCAVNKTAELGRTIKTDWLCVDCASWLRKFLEGRKVAD